MKREKLRRLYRSNPDAYAQDVLKASLTDEQATILLSLVSNRRTAVKASHAIGKTFCAAIAACWWYDCWDEHIVYITAPTWPQCLGLTFKAIVTLRRQFGLPGQIMESGRVKDNDPLRAGSHFIRALNAETGEGFQGEHSAPILQIYEEATGVPAYIWSAGDGLMTVPECRQMAIGNPTDDSTEFGKACETSTWNVLSISALTHPNIAADLRGESAPFPRAVRLGWVEEMIVKECDTTDGPGEDAFEFPVGSDLWYIPNAVFQGRVLGEFPSQADRQVIPRGWLRTLLVKDLVYKAMAQIGCDVARHGSDRSTICSRVQSSILNLLEYRKYDGDSVAGYCILEANRLGDVLAINPKQIPIHVDVTGGLGVAPVLFIRQAGYLAIEVNSSEKANDTEQYPNKRSELWFVTRDRARSKDLDLSRLSKAMKEKIERELSIPTWKVNGRGQKVVETKDDIKKRLGESPDLADAVNLAFNTDVGQVMQAAVGGERPAVAGYRQQFPAVGNPGYRIR